MNIRYATMADLDDIASVESECFPVLEAATKEEFEQRIKYYGNHFWLMFDEGKLIAFVDGFVTDEADLTDDNIDIMTLLVKCGLTASKSEARRAVQQGGVSVDGEKITDIAHTFAGEDFGGEGIVLKKGKKNFRKVIVK